MRRLEAGKAAYRATRMTALTFLAILLALARGAAQTERQTGADPQTGPSEATQREIIQEETTGTSNDRLFFALPNFLTIENASQIPPLTAKQKFRVQARTSFDYVVVPWYGFLAGISQAENSEPEYGQGAAGYGKRYGTSLADGTIENFWVFAILPSLVHQDPRFYQMPRGAFAHRAAYAMSRIFITRSDSGHRQFNLSEILGSAIAAGISTYTYHPRPERTLGNMASVWGSQVGYDAISIEVKEFWPDIRRKLRGHKEKED
jgi:hypothetical protein